MKKTFWFTLAGVALVVLQVASLVFDFVQTGALKFVSGLSFDALGYNISYLAAGVAGLVLILWGIVVRLRTKE